MARFGIPARASKKGNPNYPLLRDRSGGDESTISDNPGRVLGADPGAAVPPARSVKSNGGVVAGEGAESDATASSLTGRVIHGDGGRGNNTSGDRGGNKMRFAIGRGDKDRRGGKGKGTDPAHHHQRQYPPHGYMMPMQPGMAPPGMIPPVMMPMQPGGPGMVPYMMPPPYYNYAHYGGGNPYDYPGGNYTSRCDYSVDSSISNCSAFMCNGDEEGPLAKLIRSTVDSVANSVNRAMGEDVCDPRFCDGGDASLRGDILPSSQDHAELLEKIDMLTKLVAEKQAYNERTEDTKDLVDMPTKLVAEKQVSNEPAEDTVDLNPLDDSIEASNVVNFNAPGKANEDRGTSVEELTSLFVENTVSDEQVKVSFCIDTSNLNESFEAEAGFVNLQNIQHELIKSETKSQGPQTTEHLPPKSHAKDRKRTSQKKPLFKKLRASSRESELSGIRSSASDSSPVSVMTSLETPSCAYCGSHGGTGKGAKKLMLCSACQTTYYCSSECQLQDWTGGHSETCQAIP